MNALEKHHGETAFSSRAGQVSIKSKIGRRVLPSAVGAINITKLWEATIGMEINPEDWGRSEEQSNQLKAQSEQIARRLEGQGIQASVEGQASIIGVCTGVVEQAMSYRNTNIIPVMQSRNVHNISKHVRYFADQADPKSLRMFVASNGWVDLADYRETHKAFTRRISKLASHERVKAAGVEFVYYNVENTIKREGDNPMLNMHSHILVKSNKKLGPKKWGEFMAWCRTQFPKGYIHDSKIDNIQECVKYVFKPSEFRHLTDIELADLFHQTFRLKFFHPLGDIRTFRRELEDNKLKLVKAPPENAFSDSYTGINDKNGWQWCIMPKATPKPREKREEPRTGEDNVLVAITSPSPKFSNKFEPCIVVHNFDGDFVGLVEREEIGELVNKAQKIWDQRASMRHTTTTTVREDSPKTPPPRQYIPPDEMAHISATIN